MKSRIKLIKRQKNSPGKRIACCVGMILIIALVIVKIISGKIMPILIKVAELEAKKHSTFIVNEAVNNIINYNDEKYNIFITTLSKDGEVRAIDYDTNAVNKLLNEITISVQKNLVKMMNDDGEALNNDVYGDRKKVIAKIPVGVVFNNSILSNIGPKIPIRLHYIGDISSNVKTKITPYGINNAVIEISIRLDMTAQLYMPFVTKSIKLENSIPIATKVIQGSIPNYYGNGILKDSAIYSIPF